MLRDHPKRMEGEDTPGHKLDITISPYVTTLLKGEGQLRGFEGRRRERGREGGREREVGREEEEREGRVELSRTVSASSTAILSGKMMSNTK